MIADNPAPRAGMSTQHTATPMNEAQKRWADGLKQLELVARNAKQAEAIDVLHAACQEMAQQQIQRAALLAALRDLLGAYRMANRDAGYEEAADGVEQRAAAVIAQEEGK